MTELELQASKISLLNLLKVTLNQILDEPDTWIIDKRIIMRW